MASNPIYRYEVIDRDGSAEFGTDQVKNWAELKPSLKRNATYKGLVPSFTNTFVFVKEVRDRFKKLIDKYGYNTAARFFIYAGNSNGERNSFEQIGEGQEFIANFADKPEIDETTIQVNFEDSSFTNLFFSGHKKNIEFNKAKNLLKGDMSAYELDDITLHDRTINKDAKIDIVSPIGYTRVNSTGEFTFISTQDSNIISSDISDVKQSFRTFDPPNNEIISYFFLKSERLEPITIKSNEITIGIVSYDLDNKIENVTDGFVYFSFQLKIARHDTSFNFIEYVYESDIATITPSSTSSSISINIDDIINLNLEDSLRLEWHVKGNNTANSRGIRYKFPDGALSLNINRSEYFPPTTAKCIRPHKLFSRLTEFLTGDSDAFYSNLFGTTEDGYESDGEWSRLVALNGFMIRQFTFEDKPFITSFEEAFKAYNCIEPLALSIETINGKQRVRIEKFNDLLEDGISIKLENINSLKRIIDDERLYTIYKFGYKDIEFEEVNGLDDAFGELNYSSPLTSKDKTYDMVNKWYVGGYPIEFARRLPFSSNPTTDSKYDKFNFLIDSYLVGGKLVSRKAELFQLVEGILAPENAYNLRLTPKRNALRHGGIIKESLTRNEDESLINIKGASNQNLVTQLITEASPVVEKDDIPISTLPRPKLLAEKFSLNAALSLSQYNILNLNKNKIVNFVDISGKELSMYVDDLKYDHPKGEVEITGLRANR